MTGPPVRTCQLAPAQIPIVARAAGHETRTALIAPEGTVTYRQLLDASGRVAVSLLNGAADLEEARVAFLVSPGFPYAATQWGIWRAGGIAVPLSLYHPPPELEHVLRDSCAAAVVVDAALAGRLPPTDARRLDLAGALARLPRELPGVSPERRALILYTSGTTRRPKGVVTTHANIQAQVESLVSAWAWTSQDRLLHALPLHHIHGVINGLACCLWSGAACRMLPRFEAEGVWQCFLEEEITLFMGVPTMYVRLIEAWDAAPAGKRREMSAAAARLRLMVSGSAALPVAILERWRNMTGHTLLERYGMTETGMILSNPLDGARLPGHVGQPLPGVEVRVVDEQGSPVPVGESGEVQVRGAGVFKEYWGQPEATAAAFADEWFRTGDIATLDADSYRLLGRSSVDIIKTGGYKVSALEVEDLLREHPAIRDCAVVGLPDATWGERVAAAVVLETGARLTLNELRSWGKERLAPYKIPTRLAILAELPRNAMGKVSKTEVARLVAPPEE